MTHPRTPYLKWRNGRPRWEPGPGLRRAGFKGRNLQDDNGDWLSYGLAIEAAQKLNREVDDWSLGRERLGCESPAQRPPVSEQRTVQALFDIYFSGEHFRDLAPKTRRDYRSKARAFLAQFGEAPVLGA